MSTDETVNALTIHPGGYHPAGTVTDFFTTTQGTLEKMDF